MRASRPFLVFAVAAALAGCSSNPAPAPTPSESPSSVGTATAATSAPPTSVPSPIPSPGGVVPADPHGLASTAARSVVAVVAAGRIDFIDRILGDVQSSSTCTPFPSIKVLERSDLGGEREYVRRVVRVARAHEGIDGVGTARGRMHAGVEWPGVEDPYVVDVVIAVDCPEESA